MEDITHSSPYQTNVGPFLINTSRRALVWYIAS